MFCGMLQRHASRLHSVVEQLLTRLFFCSDRINQNINKPLLRKWLAEKASADGQIGGQGQLAARHHHHGDGRPRGLDAPRELEAIHRARHLHVRHHDGNAFISKDCIA